MRKNKMPVRLAILFTALTLLMMTQLSAQDIGCNCESTSIPQLLSTVSSYPDEWMIEMAENVDDIENGNNLYNSPELGCVVCHGDETIAPLTKTMWDNVIKERLKLEQFAEYTPERYIIESILLPNKYEYPDDVYPAGVMPENYGDRMYQQDLIDIVAYLKTFKTDD